MLEYKNAKIYKLQCDDGYYYIGSTCDTLNRRKWDHKDASIRKPNRELYQHINSIGWDRVQIVLIEEYRCENKDQLRQREDYYIQQNRNELCLNIKRAFTSPEDARKRHNETNTILRRKKEKMTCECGSIFHPYRIREHERSIKHQTFLSRE